MKNKLLRIVSLLLCLVMMLCLAGCVEDATTAKKKKKVVVVKKKPAASSETTDDVSDLTSDIISVDDSDDDFVETEGKEGTLYKDKDYTVNGTPVIYVTTANGDVKFRKQNGSGAKEAKVQVFDKGSAEAKNFIDSLSGATTTMDVDANKTYQTMKGFGASMTGSSVFNMELMDSATRDELMTRLFDPEKGIGLSILRQPIGCGDYNYLYYTYDEMPQGESDMDLSHFSFDKELKYVAKLPPNYYAAEGGADGDNTTVDLATLPYVKKAMSLNKNMMVVGSVWTAPRWMKTVYSWNTVTDSSKNPFNPEGSPVVLRNDCFDVYSKYIIKSLQAYKDNGVEYYMITPVNEPTAAHGIPSTTFDATTAQNLVNYYLVDDLKASGLNTKLYAWEFNWMSECLDFVGTQYGNIDGVAFHFYGGDIGILQQVTELFPDLDIMFTECAGDSNGGQPTQLFRQMSHMANELRYGSTSWILWNICLDPGVNDESFKAYAYGGHSGGGPGGNDGIAYNKMLISTDPVTGQKIYDPNTVAYNEVTDNYTQDMSLWGTGLTQYNHFAPAGENKLTYQMDFYILAHFSKFMHKGAKIIDATDINLENSLMYNVAAVNEDGSVAVVIGNEGLKPANFVINFGDKVIVVSNLDAASVATVAWDANVYL